MGHANNAWNKIRIQRHEIKYADNDMKYKIYMMVYITEETFDFLLPPSKTKIKNTYD